MSQCAQCDYEPIGLKPEGWLCGVCRRDFRRSLIAVLETHDPEQLKQPEYIASLVCGFLEDRNEPEYDGISCERCHVQPAATCECDS